MTDPYTTDGGSNGDQSEQPFGLTYDIDSSELPSEAVVRAVAALTNSSPLELNPLYDAIDPEHLDTTFERASENTASTTMTFTYSNCTITVTRGVIRVRSSDSDSS